jgi:hypothetical protein
MSFYLFSVHLLAYLQGFLSYLLFFSDWLCLKLHLGLTDYAFWDDCLFLLFHFDDFDSFCCL